MGTISKKIKLITLSLLILFSSFFFVFNNSNNKNSPLPLINNEQLSNDENKIIFNIDNVTEIKSTLEGFNFKIDISSKNGEPVIQNLKIFVFANGDMRTQIWESVSFKNDEIGEGMEFSAIDLLEGTIYHDLTFLLVNADSVSEIYSNTFKTDVDITPTNNEIQTIYDKDFPPRVLSENKRDFVFSVNAIGNHPGTKDDPTVIASPYKVGLFEGDSIVEPFWISEVTINAGPNTTFVVGGLEPGTKFTNVRVSMIYVDTNLREGNFYDLSNEISTLPLLGPLDIVIISLLCMMFILGLFYSLTLYSKYKNGKSYWINKIKRKDQV